MIVSALGWRRLNCSWMRQLKFFQTTSTSNQQEPYPLNNLSMSKSKIHYHHYELTMLLHNEFIFSIILRPEKWELLGRGSGYHTLLLDES